MKNVEFFKCWANKTKCKILDLRGYEAEAVIIAVVCMTCVCVMLLVSSLLARAGAPK